MTADRTYTRVRFAPADECALGPVTIYAADGVTKLGIIPVSALRKRKSAVPLQHSGVIAPREERPNLRAPRSKRWAQS